MSNILCSSIIVIFHISYQEIRYNQSASDPCDSETDMQLAVARWWFSEKEKFVPLQWVKTIFSDLVKKTNTENSLACMKLYLIQVIICWLTPKLLSWMKGRAIVGYKKRG